VGVGRVEGGGLTMLSDTGDQVVCTVGQMVTAALTIPRGEQTSSGTIWDNRLPY